MDLSNETEALLEGLAGDGALTDPLAEPATTAAGVPADTADALIKSATAVNTDSVPQSTDEEPVQGQSIVDKTTVVSDADGTVTETTVVSTSAPELIVEVSTAAANEDSGANAEAQAVPDAAADAQPVKQAPSTAAADSVPVSDIAVNGVAEANGSAALSGTAEPERGRNRKRRARWGPPANAPKESAADGAANGEPTGRKRRRSRLEEPPPEVEDSQALTVVDTSGGSGFPHEIVLAGGIKVICYIMPASLACFCSSMHCDCALLLCCL